MMIKVMKHNKYPIDKISTTQVEVNYRSDDTVELKVLCWKKWYTKVVSYDKHPELKKYLVSEFNLEADYTDRIMTDIANTRRIRLSYREFKKSDIPRIIELNMGYTREYLNEATGLDVACDNDIVIGVLDYNITKIEDVPVVDIHKIQIVSQYGTILDIGGDLLRNRESKSPSKAIINLYLDRDCIPMIKYLEKEGYRAEYPESHGKDKLILRKYRKVGWF